MIWLPFLVFLLVPGSVGQPVAMVAEYTNWWACFAAILALSVAIAEMLFACCGPSATFNPDSCLKAMAQVGVAEAAVTAACQ